MMEYIIRFLAGGIAVSLFSVMGDLLRLKASRAYPGAAPSIAVATLALTISAKGVGYAELEARSMMLGFVALCLYSASVCHLTSYRAYARHAGDGAYAARMAGLRLCPEMAAGWRGLMLVRSDSLRCGTRTGMNMPCDLGWADWRRSAQASSPRLSARRRRHRIRG